MTFRWTAGVFLSLSSFYLVNAAVLTQVTGSVTFQGKPVSQGQPLEQPGVLETGPQSKAVVLLSQTGQDKSEIALAADTRVNIEPADAKAHSLLAGSLRARLNDKASRSRFSVKTSSAVMAVRGTDFLAAFGPMLNESEIVVFEGTVKFSSALSTRDSKNVSKGYWGGVGGRYGHRIGDLIALPAPVLKHFEESSAF